MLADGQTKVMAPSAALATAPPREEPNVSRDRPLVNETRRDELNEMLSFKGGDKAADGSTPKADAPAAAPSAITAQSRRRNPRPRQPRLRLSRRSWRRRPRRPAPRQRIRPPREALFLPSAPEADAARRRSSRRRRLTLRKRPHPIPSRRCPWRRRQALSPATPPRRRPLCRRNPASAKPRRSKRDWPIWRRR